MHPHPHDWHDHDGPRRHAPGRGRAEWPTRDWQGHDGPRRGDFDESRFNDPNVGPRGGRGPGRGGPPPWLAALLGADGRQGQRGPRARRGDVRGAILDVLSAGPLNGYQIIQQIKERTEGAWRPSPGSVYPTMQQLEDEGLIEPDDPSSGKAVCLTDAGQAYVTDHREELAAIWSPFRPEHDEARSTIGPEVGKFMQAFGQVMAVGTEAQKERAVQTLVEARKGLYKILADE